MSEETSIYAPSRGGRFAGVLALLIALLICLPAHAQMAPPAASQTMPGAMPRTMPGQMANPMMMPNVNPNMMPNNGGNMGGNAGDNMGGTMMNPGGGMQTPYMPHMSNPGGVAAPSSGRRLTPSFVGLTRSEASALAQQYGLAPAFDGADSDDARVASQAPEAGTLIFRTAMPVRFEMRAPRAAPPPPAPAMPAPVSPTASPAAPTQATPPPVTPTEAPAPQPPTPTAAPAKPAPARTLTPPPTPATPSRNWWILLAIAAGLVGVMWALLARRKRPEPVVPRFNNPQAGALARLATQIVGTGLAEATVSVGGAAAPRFELRYVVDHGAQPDGTVISVGGGENGG